MPSLLSMGSGASEGLDTFFQRLMEEQKLRDLEGAQSESARHNRATEDLASRQHTLQSMDAMARIRAMQEEHDQASADRQLTAGRETAEIIPGNTRLAEGDPAIGLMQKAGLGSILKMKSAEPELPQDFQGPLEPGDTREAMPAGMLKMKTARQIEKDLADQRAQEAARRQQENDAERTRHDRAMENKPGASVVVQTPSGYAVVDKGKGTSKPVTAPGGNGNLPLAPTGTTRTMMEGASMLEPHIQDMKAQTDALDQAGLFGPAMSRIRALAAKAGSVDDFYGLISSDPELTKDPAVGRFATSLGLLATGAARVHGGARGGGSPQMLQHFKSILSDAGTPGMFKGRLDALDDYMRGYAAGPGATGATGGASPSATPGRTKFDMNGNIIP